MTTAGNTVLIVEDQRIVAADLEATLEALGYSVGGQVTSGEEAVEKAAELLPDLVLMDIRLRGEMDGIEAARIIRDRFDLPVVFLTAYVDEETIRRAKEAGPFGYVVKPYTERELRAAIEIALHKHEMDRMLGEEKARRRAAEHAQQRSAFLAQLGNALATTLDSDLILQRVVQLPLPFLGDASLVIEMPERGEPKQVAEAAQPFDGVELLRGLREVPVPATVVQMMRTVIASGRASQFDDFTTWLETSSPTATAYVEALRKLQARSAIVAPIALRTSTFGVLLLLGKSTRATHTPEEVSLAEEIGQRTGLSLENVRLYRASQETAQTFRLLVEGVKDYAIFKLDLNGRVKTWNAGAERIEGYTAGEVIGRHFSLFYPSEDIDRGKPAAVLQRAMQEGRAAHEGWCVRKDGTRFWADVVISPVRDDGGYMLGFAEVTRDLTDRKRADDAQRFLDQATVALGSSLDVAESLERASRFAVPVLADWCLVDLVDAAGQLNTVAASHVDGPKEAFARRLGRDVRPAVEASHGPLRALRTGSTDLFPPLETEWSGAPLGPEHPELMRALGVLSYVCVPIQYRAQTLGVLSFLRGAPPRRYTSRDVMVAEDFARRAGLAAANAHLFQDAQDAIRVRDEFLQVASHELRTPLAPMQLQVDALGRSLQRSGLLSDQLSATLDMFTRQLDRLNKLVETLLDVTRITGGRLMLQVEELDFVEMVREVVGRHRAELEKAGCNVVLNADGPVIGRWDRLRVEQVVSNLLSNAMKYGPGKPIEIDLQEGEGTVRCVVRDHGIGIEKEALGRIFGRFERGVSVRHYGGLGLGLYIARQIAESHGGTIVAQSHPGQGSTFTFVLPLQPAVAPLDGVEQAHRAE